MVHLIGEKRIAQLDIMHTAVHAIKNEIGLISLVVAGMTLYVEND